MVRIWAIVRGFVAGLPAFLGPMLIKRMTCDI
jgi:hypothetical protein